MKLILKILLMIFIFSFLGSCVSSRIRREAYDENSSGLYGYFEFDKDTKFYGKEFVIGFVREEDEFRTIVQYGGVVKDDNTFWIPNLNPGTYSLHSIYYTRNYYTHSINFHSKNTFTVGEGEIVYFGAYFCTQKDEIYSIQPHTTITRSDVLDNIEDTLLEYNWAPWLEKARNTIY